MKHLLREIILGSLLLIALFAWEFIKACFCTFVLGLSPEEQLQLNSDSEE